MKVKKITFRGRLLHGGFTIPHGDGPRVNIVGVLSRWKKRWRKKFTMGCKQGVAQWKTCCGEGCKLYSIPDRKVAPLSPRVTVYRLGDFDNRRRLHRAGYPRWSRRASFSLSGSSLSMSRRKLPMRQSRTRNERTAGLTVNFSAFRKIHSATPGIDAHKIWNRM